jgi:serine/threonine-protein kinase RIM15
MSLSLDKAQSASSSRSTSRSRSPMPASRPRFLMSADVEDPLANEKLFLAALQDLIVIATEVLDSSVNALASEQSSCTKIIQSLQKVGQRWDDHDDWPGRSWYVDVLMAVANLSRVLDWWEAEKGFWNFDEDDENEPLVFVLRPKEESKFEQEFKAHNDRSSPVLHVLPPDVPIGGLSLDIPSPTSSGGLATGRTVIPTSAETPKAQAVEDLRFLAEHAKMVNIVMELSLKEEQILYVNEAIMEVTG